MQEVGKWILEIGSGVHAQSQCSADGLMARLLALTVTGERMFPPADLERVEGVSWAGQQGWLGERRCRNVLPMLAYDGKRKDKMLPTGHVGLQDRVCVRWAQN